jgi:hypothetical protein
MDERIQHSLQLSTNEKGTDTPLDG